jgi:hypothetical protein
MIRARRAVGITAMILVAAAAVAAGPRAFSTTAPGADHGPQVHVADAGELTAPIVEAGTDVWLRSDRRRVSTGVTARLVVGLEGGIALLALAAAAVGRAPRSRRHRVATAWIARAIQPRAPPRLALA